MRIRNPNMPRSPREDGVNQPSRGPRGPMAPPVGRGPRGPMAPPMGRGGMNPQAIAAAQARQKSMLGPQSPSMNQRQDLSSMGPAQNAGMGKPGPQQMQGLAAGAGMGLGAMGARGATSGMGMAGYKNGGSVMSGRAQVKGKKFTGTF